MKIAIAFFVLLVLSVPAAFAQQYSHYGNMPDDKPQSTNLDVISRILDALNSFFGKVLTLGNQQDADLKTIIANQQKEINLLQQLVSKK